MTQTQHFKLDPQQVKLYAAGPAMLAFIEEFVTWDVWLCLPFELQKVFIRKQDKMKKLIAGIALTSL